MTKPVKTPRETILNLLKGAYHIDCKECNDAIDSALAQLEEYYKPKGDGTMKLLEELTHLLNRASRENESNTPDFILAEFMMSCLIAGEILIKTREKWYGKYMSINEEKSI